MWIPRNRVIAEDIAQVVSAPLAWSGLSGATVLVTGASGFLPAYLVETLLALNRGVLDRPGHVVALVRNAARARERFQEHLDNPHLEFLVQDVCDPLPAGRGFDFVIHAASQASPRYYRVDPAGTLAANTLGTYHLLRAAQSQPVRGFLFFSSGDVYGVHPDLSHPMTESDFGSLDPADVRSCYGESKRMGETMCASWAHQYGVPTKIVRPFHTYGPGMRLDDGRVFADFVRDILAGGPIVLHSDGSARRCFCYLADATCAFFRVLLEGAPGEAYNVVNPDAEASIAELADRLAALFGHHGVRVERRERPDGAYVPSPIAAVRPSAGKIRALGWRPVTTIEEGFLRTVESYRRLPSTRLQPGERIEHALQYAS